MALSKVREATNRAKPVPNCFRTTRMAMLKNEKATEKVAFVGAEGFEPPTLCL